MLLRFRPLVNFINISQAAFVPIFFAKKFQIQNVSKEKLQKTLMYKKVTSQCWNWHLIGDDDAGQDDGEDEHDDDEADRKIVVRVFNRSSSGSFIYDVTQFCWQDMTVTSVGWPSIFLGELLFTLLLKNKPKKFRIWCLSLDF